MKPRIPNIIKVLVATACIVSSTSSKFSTGYLGGLELEPPMEDNFAVKTLQEIHDEQELELKKEEEEEEVLEESFFDAPIAPVPEFLSVDYLKANITDFHTSVKGCLDDHFKRDVQDQIQLKLIVQDCAGKKGDTLTRYYNDIKFLIKKYLYETIIQTLRKGYCDEDFNSCMEYFRSIQVFVELNFDIASSIDANFDILESIMGVDKLQYLKSLTVDVIGEFNELRIELRRQQEFLLHYFRLKREQYGQEYAGYQESKDKDSEEDQSGEEEGESKPSKGRHSSCGHGSCGEGKEGGEKHGEKAEGEEHGEHGGHDEHGSGHKEEELTSEEIRSRLKVSKMYKQHLYHYAGTSMAGSGANKANQNKENAVNNFVPDP